MWHLSTLTPELKEATEHFLIVVRGQGAVSELSLWGGYPYMTSEN